MSFCPNCGMENAKTATECRRCHVPLELQAEATAPEPLAVSSDDLSNQLGEVCRRCESYNEPGTPRCTTCGYKLILDPGEELEPIEPRQQAGLEEPGHAEPAAHEAAHHEPAAHHEVPAAHFDEPAYAEPQQTHHDEHAAPAHEAFPEHTPPSPVPAHVAPHNEELAAYAISADEAASAAHVDPAHKDIAAAFASVEPLDHTPPDPMPVARVLPPPPIATTPAAGAKGKSADVALAAGAALAGAAIGVGVAAAFSRPLARVAPPRSTPPPPVAGPSDTPPNAVAPPTAANENKACPTCGTPNPAAAKFCAECGTPFKATAAKPAAEPPRRVAPIAAELVRRPPPEAPSIVVAEEAPLEPVLLAEQPETPTSLDASGPELHQMHDADAIEDLPAESIDDTRTGESPPLLVPIEPEPPAQREAPFHVSVVVERGSAVGTTFVLAHQESSFGGPGAAVSLADDPHLAPHAATFVFEDTETPAAGGRVILRDEGAEPSAEAPHLEGMRYVAIEEHPAQAHRLLLRDEGSANGIFVKVRGSVRLEPGDQFAAGERLLRFDGAQELPPPVEGEVPLLGSPRPQSAQAVRISEVLMGGNTGRTCHRAGPVIAVGRTGCDLNFPSDPLLAPRHAEVRLDEGGNALLCDLGANPEGVFVRLRPNTEYEVPPGALLRVGGQLLKVEMG